MDAALQHYFFFPLLALSSCGLLGKSRSIVIHIQYIVYHRNNSTHHDTFVQIADDGQKPNMFTDIR